MAETIKHEELQELIEECQRRALDFRSSPDERAAAAALSNQLTDRAMRLLGGDFSARTAKVEAANARLTETNRALKEAADDAAKRASTLDDVARVVKVLDELLSAVADIV